MQKSRFLTHFLLACFSTYLTTCKPSSEDPISKIIFETEPCFGTCPVFYLEIDSSKEAKLFVEAEYIDNDTFEFQQDTSRIGFFQGSIDKKQWQKLVSQLKIMPWDKSKNDLVQTDVSHKHLLIYKEGKVCGYNTFEHEHPLLNSPETFFNIYEKSHWVRTPSFPVKKMK